jgi:hypothetical protein
MSLLLALTASAGGGGVSADLSVTDAPDVLASAALVLVGTSLDVADSADALAATANIEAAPIEEPASLGGRNKLLDAPAYRVRVALSVTDDSDQLYAVAKVAQLVRKAVPVVVPLVNRRAALSVVDDADTLEAKTRGSWPERYMITRPKVKMVSSKYEAVA